MPEDLPPLKLAEAGQLVQSLVSVYQKAGTITISSVEDESAIYVSRLAANLVNAKNRSWLGGSLCVRGFW
jgi:elongation factor 3